MEEQTKQSIAIDVPNPSGIPIVQNEPQIPNNTVNNGLANINLLDETQIARAEFFLKKIMRSDKGGIKSIEDGLAIMMRAQDLNVPFSTAIEHVHVINGKTGVDIHVIKALLLKAGVTWDKPIKDYAPLYEYTDGFNVYIDGSFPDYVVRCNTQAEAKEKSDNNKDDLVYVYPVKYYQDFNGNVYKDYQLNNNFKLVCNKQQVAQATTEKKIPIIRIPNKPVDFITEYELHRTVNGKEITAIGRFSYSEAINAGFFEKDTYKKYPKILIGHRAFTYAAREIASDIILGAYETTELKIVNGMDIDDQDCIEVTSR